MRYSWLGNMMESSVLAITASQLVALRTVKIAASGKAANAKTVLMAREEVDALQQLQARAAAGKLSHFPNAALGQALDHSGRVIAANRRRLAKRG